MEKKTQLHLIGQFGVVAMLAGALTAPLAAQAALVTATWNASPASGTWMTASNWDTGVVPKNGTDTYIVNIDGGKAAASLVTLTMPASPNHTVIDSFVIDAGDTLRINGSNAYFQTTGTSTNNGTLEMSATNPRISGGTKIINNGLIRSNGGTFLIQSVPIENNGIIRAHSGAVVLNNGASVTNTNGLIETTNNQNLGINNATITGGTLNINGTSVLDIRGSAVLAGDIAFTAASGTRIYCTETTPRTFTWHASGTYDHNGWFRTDIGSNRFLNLALTGGTVTIGGTGIIDLGVGRVITGSGTGNRGLISHNTISGMGNIGNNQLDSFVNRGTVLANNATTPLTIQLRSGVVQNEAAISVTGAAGLNVLNPLTTSGTVAVNAGTAMTVSGIFTQTAGTTTVNGTLTAAQFMLQGGTLAGSGQVVGPLTIDAGGTIAPGNSAGTINGTDAIWNGGGTYEWEVHNWAGGTPGTDWDLVALTGTLAINATAGNPFVIRILPDDTNGLINFKHDLHSFTILTAGGGITGFNPAAFVFDTSAWGQGILWQVQQEGNSLVLNYIPEPTTAVLLALGSLAVRRRRG